LYKGRETEAREAAAASRRELKEIKKESKERYEITYIINIHTIRHN
jgi:hypothetical protein